MSVLWLAETRVGQGRVVYRIGREDGALIAEWPSLARLRCVPGSHPELTAAAEADASRVAKVKAGLAAALVRSLAGGVTLHASAVAKEGRAVLCLGPSGAGKSTMAALLCARSGYGMLADDMCEVRWSGDPGSHLLAIPGETHTWLLADGSQEKTPRLQRAAHASAHVQALVCMSAGAEAAQPRLEPLRGAALFARLVPCLVRFALDDPSAHARELRTLSSLCRLPSYELTRSREPARAGDAADLLAGLVEGG